MENKKINKIKLSDFWCEGTRDVCFVRGQVFLNDIKYPLLVGVSKSYLEDKYQGKFDTENLQDKFFVDIKKDIINNDFFIQNDIVYKIYSESESGSKKVREFMINNVIA